MNFSPQSPQITNSKNRYSGNSTFSTPERQRRSQEQNEEILRHTPAPKKTSKRKSLMQCYNQAQIYQEKNNFSDLNFESPNQNKENIINLEPIQESSNQYEDEYSNSSMGTNFFNNQGSRNFFQKLTDSEYKPSKCYQLLFSENEDSNNNNNQESNNNMITQTLNNNNNKNNNNIINNNFQQQQNQYEPVNFQNYNPLIHKENLNMGNQSEYQKIGYSPIKTDPLTEFLLNYNLKSNKILDYFNQEQSTIEVIGEEQHSIKETLQALASNIDRFQFIQDNIQKQEFEGKLVISTNGTLESKQFSQGEFVMSAKIMDGNPQIIETLKVLIKVDM